MSEDLTEGGKKPQFWRERRADYDPGRLLTYMALLFVGMLIVFVSAIIAVQIWKKDVANTESWAALTGLIGWATSQVSIIFSNRFGTTQQAAKKDDVIARQANAVMVQAGKANPAEPVVTAAPMNPATGVVPAVEVAQPENKP